MGEAAAKGNGERASRLSRFLPIPLPAASGAVVAVAVGLLSGGSWTAGLAAASLVLPSASVLHNRVGPRTRRTVRRVPLGSPQVHHLPCQIGVYRQSYQCPCCSALLFLSPFEQGNNTCRKLRLLFFLNF